MPLSPGLAAWLRDRGCDAVHAAELGLTRSSDPEIIAHASEQGRTIVTADLDYPRLLAFAQAIGPSLILFRDGNWSEADIVKRMNEILRRLDPDDVQRSILVVDRNRVRRRRLPIA